MLISRFDLDQYLEILNYDHLLLDNRIIKLQIQVFIPPITLRSLTLSI